MLVKLRLNSRGGASSNQAAHMKLPHNEPEIVDVEILQKNRLLLYLHTESSSVGTTIRDLSSGLRWSNVRIMLWDGSSRLNQFCDLHDCCRLFQ
jgi:hypothetical protein